MVTFEEQYISLQEASRGCAYSQEYLSLRARQGKLRAMKIKRNWVTTKEWLNEYIQRAEQFKRQTLKAIFKETDPPLNLPTEELLRAQQALLNPPISFSRLAFVSVVPILILAGIIIAQKPGTITQQFAQSLDAGILMYSRDAFALQSHMGTFVFAAGYAFAEDFDSGFLSVAKGFQAGVAHVGSGIDYGISSPASFSQAYADVNGALEEQLKKDFAILKRGFQRFISYFSF